MQWEILHIPAKPTSSFEQSTVDVLASNIEPKLANSLVRQLNQVCPLENLRHVKRVRRRSVEGKIELSVILCLSSENENHMEDIPNDVLQLINAHQLSPFNAKVARYAAASKEEWEEQCKLWPTSYHPSTNADGVTGFNEEESQYVFKCMKVAFDLAKTHYHGDKVVNAAVIVDPSCRHIIASACDQTCPRSTLTNETGSKLVSCIEREANTTSTQSDADGLASSKERLFPNFSPDKCSDLYFGVSCLNPWGWAEQRPHHQHSEHQCGNNYPWHPLRHAALIAIEKAAERDRQLFPSIGSSKNLSILDHDLKFASDSSLAKRQKTQVLKNEHSLVNKDGTNSLSSETTRPYLCTGFDIYLVWEPCAMCAMALVHQRIQRIFYALPNPNAGALGSVYRLQGEKSLNHHYSVFRILIPEKALYQVESNGSDDCPLQN
ncbi:tRNA-specific adenosine deaminase TAD3 isoform X2 [Phoenix dactylifera]|uniref:tRNA-specific adenosine deaminase TAD3 isoform X2 n=1 Tax=Phoenix dactylifera TaxID=42345 RepID=A0A8B7BNC5_PHODC|nr:tRNA-specific adenosine deaminase TAD3 isoform X2 [Phoenix dactylifera]